MNKFLKLIILSSSFLYCVSSFGLDTQFFVSAHQDDWQLFMNPNAHDSVTTQNTKTVFIHITAGDAGAGNGSRGNQAPYYLARNEGALRAIRFLTNTDNKADRGADMQDSIRTINGHNVQRYEYANTVAYFLNLPDGNANGGGFSGTSNQSLSRLYRGVIDRIDAVDGSASYLGWNDLLNTVEELVNVEAQTINSIKFHSADTNTSVNSDDHSDHLYSSLLMQAIAKSNSCIEQRFYRDYITRELPDNVSRNDLLIQAATWGATTSGISDSYHSSTWDSSHNAWLGRQYFRTILASASNKCGNSSNNNLAQSATVTASSQNTRTEQTANKIMDGFIDGWPGDHKKEWVTEGQKAGAWLKLNWNTPVEVTRIKLYDRPNTTDHITSAAIVFSNGDKVNVPPLNNSGTATIINLPSPVLTNSLELRINSTSNNTQNVGLSELEVIGNN